jgi:hypothetical protein
LGGSHACEEHHVAHGQVDAARRHDEGLADGDDEQHCDVHSHGPNVELSQELARRQEVEQPHQDDEKKEDPGGVGGEGSGDD